MKPEEVKADIDWIEELPGKKIIYIYIFIFYVKMFHLMNVGFYTAITNGNRLFKSDLALAQTFSDRVFWE